MDRSVGWVNDVVNDVPGEDLGAWVVSEDTSSSVVACGWWHDSLSIQDRFVFIWSDFDLSTNDSIGMVGVVDVNVHCSILKPTELLSSEGCISNNGACSCEGDDWGSSASTSSGGVDVSSSGVSDGVSDGPVEHVG